MHAYTELITRRPISERQRPREANDELRHGHRLHRLSQARLSQPMHPVAFGSNQSAQRLHVAAPLQISLSELGNTTA